MRESRAGQLEARTIQIFLLGAMAGLRRNEIDKLPWTAFRFDEGVIHIQTTEYFRPKSRESENDIPVDPVLALGAPPSGRLGGVHHSGAPIKSPWRASWAQRSFTQ